MGNLVVRRAQDARVEYHTNASEVAVICENQIVKNLNSNVQSESPNAKIEINSNQIEYESREESISKNTKTENVQEKVLNNAEIHSAQAEVPKNRSEIDNVRLEILENIAELDNSATEAQDDRMDMAESESGNMPHCYICKNDNEDCFVSPCDCSGCVEFVHLECIKQWYKVNYNPMDGPLQCPICKSKFLQLELKLWPHQLLNYEAFKKPLIFSMFALLVMSAITIFCLSILLCYCDAESYKTFSGNGLACVLCMGFGLIALISTIVLTLYILLIIICSWRHSTVYELDVQGLLTRRSLQVLQRDEEPRDFSVSVNG